MNMESNNDKAAGKISQDGCENKNEDGSVASGTTSSLTSSMQLLKDVSYTLNAAANRPTCQPRLEVRDALAYLDQIKAKLADQPLGYKAFLDLVLDFNSKRISPACFTDRVLDLFKDHPDLIAGFHRWLPPELMDKAEAMLSK